MKDYICGAAGIVLGAAASLFGGWDGCIATLVILMGIDYITGLLVAGVFHASKKSKNGSLESRAGFKGLCRKGVTMLIVLIAAMLERVSGVGFIRDAVVIAYIASELISITENAGLMGVPIPGAILRAIDILKDSSENEESKSENKGD